MPQRLPLLHGLRQLFVEKLDRMLDGRVLIHHILNRFAGMYDRTVISASKGAANFLQGMFGEHSRQIHGNLTRKGNVGGTATREHVSHSEVIVINHFFLNCLDGDAT